jgi:glycogen debranching enzyme
MEGADLDDDQYLVVATSSLSASGTRVLKHDDMFGVFDRHGDVRSTGRGEQGLYYRGTRFLSRMRLKLGNQRLLLLSSNVLHDNLLFAVDLTNPDMFDSGERVIPYGTLHVSRSKFVWNHTAYERLQVSNFGPQAIETELELEFDSDFADVFEVRGTHRKARGARLPASVDRSVELAYEGLDGRVLRTRFDFAPAPDGIHEHRVSFRVHLEVKQSKEFYVWTSCYADEPSRGTVPYETAFVASADVMRRKTRGQCSIVTGNEQFNDWIERSQADLRMMITDTHAGPYPYAGVPWFSTPFGRDGIWTAIEALWVNSDIAAGVLRFLAATQAIQEDPERDAEPGKILHELREGEMANLGEVPFGRYYGSVDSTPLFLMLAARYFEATGDRALVESLWPHFIAALDWMDTWGDLDGDGFLEYGRRSKHGLVQQGWKDSSDSVFHHDGTLAEGPVALCEVQGYAYAARLGMANVARALGHAALAADLEQRAATLRRRFDDAFWCDDIGTYALALDGHKRPCRVKTSNAGHALYTGIALPHRADRLAGVLLSSELFSGWGIRTVAASEQRYNPMAYHNGSIWPHDNAIVAAGLASYGHVDAAARVLSGLFDATLFVDLHRLPELFCGFERRPSQGPTLYPVACSPQAWASAAPFMLLKSILRVRARASERRVTFEHPVLPDYLDDVWVKALRVGDATVDLRLHRYPDDVGINVLGKTGNVEVVLVK